MNAEWKSLLLTEDKTIKDALEVINRESLRMALVLNGHGELVGSVTDGDIRRGILKGYNVTETVCNIMNKQPKFVSKSATEKAALEIMEREHINCLPILDEKKIVSIHCKENYQGGRIDNPVFLMAGGFGKRLRPLTYDCPKPLLKVGDTPILEIILERFIHHGFYKFYISTHYMSEMVKEYFGNGEKWGVDIDYVEESKPLGTAGALGLIDSSSINKPVIVMNGDILTGVDFRELLSFHEECAGTATMCVSEYEYEIPFGVVNSCATTVESIVEKPKHKVNINSGIYILEPEVLKKIKPNSVVDMPTLLRKEMANGKHVNTFQIFEYWMDIGRKEDFEQAQLNTKPRVISMVR